MKWDHTDYTACNARVALPLQKDRRWRGQRRTTGLSRCNVFRQGKAEGKCLHGNCTMRRGSLQLVRYMEQSSQVRPPSWSHECIHPVVQAVPCHVSPQQQEAWHTHAVAVGGWSPLFHVLQEDPDAYQARDPLVSHQLGLATPSLCNSETGKLNRGSTGTMGPFPSLASSSLREVHQ